jgi:photosystem II stability/assembly factor-like uncharacterized protein
MSKLSGKLLILIPILAFVLNVLFHKNNYENKNPDFKYIPGDWFHFQRAFPYQDYPAEKYFEAFDQKVIINRISKSNFNGDWHPLGPSNIGGRITALDVDPVNNIIYAGAAAGGIFKSTDGGNSWEPRTDFYPSLSIGALVIDPGDPSIIYCGTGEANMSGDSYPGFGMLKSTDYGETWFFSGLENSRHIAEIEIGNLNSNLIYAAVSGGLYSKGPDRGIYKSTDAGTSWNKVFYLNDSTSAIDVAIDYSDNNIVYAAMFERLRGPSFRKASGQSSGIYKSTDGGTTWNRLTNGLPGPDPKIGRISIAVAPGNSNYVYALYKSASSPNGSTNTFYNFYKSTDKGLSWTQQPQGILSSEFSNFGWYFGVIEVDPSDFNKVYVGDIDLFVSTNGGGSWSNITYSYSGTFDQQHPDQHALWINPSAPNHLIVGNDGGVFSTTNSGNFWIKSYNLPVSQFYASTIDYLQPMVKAGGTQDNGTLRNGDGSIDNWQFIYGGDGFHTLIDYTNSNIIYAEYQYGGLGKSTDGGLSFFDATQGIDFSRTNWSTPYIMDNQNPNILFLGTYKLHKTTNGGNSWNAISPDLTRGPNGRLGTITCISSAIGSDNSTRILYVGTDDARLSVSTNGGTNWFDRTGVLPQRYMTDVVADKRNPAVAYVTLSGYNLDETNPHIFRTTDFGVSWIGINGNLPDVPLNSVILDYDYDSVLYVGSDVGVFYTTNLGLSWQVLGNGLPNSPVSDLNFHQPTRKLVAGTHGRSLFEIDVTNISGNIEETSSELNFVLQQNYPNPFNPVTKISWQSPAGGWQTLRVFNLSGEEVATIVNEYKPSGSFEVEFDAGKLPSGIYFYKLTVGSYSQTKKMVLLK